MVIQSTKGILIESRLLHLFHPRSPDSEALNPQKIILQKIYTKCIFLLDKRKNMFYKLLVVDARVAQLVEQRTENPRVGGSIPSPSTT